MNDVVEFAKSRPNVNYRHFFKPSEYLGGVRQEMDFRNETTWHFQEVGRADAKAALDSAKESDEPEFSFANVLMAHYNTVMSEIEQYTTSLFMN